MFILSQNSQDLINLNNVTHLSIEPHYYGDSYDIVAHFTSSGFINIGTYESRKEADYIRNHILDSIRNNLQLLVL